MPTRFWLRFAILLLGGGLLLGACQSEPDSSVGSASGESASEAAVDRTVPPTELVPVNSPPPAPEVTLPTMEGRTFRLSAHEGKVVVLNFWATWCGPCRYEIPGFIDLQRELGGRGLEIVGVSLDREGFAAVRPYAKEKEINYTLVADDGSAERAYGPFRSIPQTYVIGRDGTVRYVAKGALAESKLRRVVEKLLAE
jgi:peroxiredoxin